MSLDSTVVGPAVVIGVGATLLLDLWNLFLKRAFHVPSLSYCLLGPGQAIYHALAAKHWKAGEPATRPGTPGSAPH